MRRSHSRVAATVLAAAAGGLAAFALRPAAGTTTATLAARNPAVEVRTQVIRRTIHVIRHEPGAALRGARGPSLRAVNRSGPTPPRVRTAASGAHRASTGPVAGASVPVSTHSSGPHGGSTSPSPSHPVTTRSSSGPHGGSTSPSPSHPVTTRSSGGSHGGSSGPSAGMPVTRSSGGAHGHGDDGGDGNGGRDD
jgi:hypothetical protein